MPIQDRFNRAAAVAKWKVDQQSRIYKIQGQIRELENSIKTKKSDLAEKTLLLFQQNHLVEEDLLAICNSIAEAHRQIEAKRLEEEQVKKEQPPETGQYSSQYPTPQISTISLLEKSGLVCPECGRELVGKFCPVHGVEGVMKSQPIESDGQSSTQPSGDQLYCPQCHKPLRGKFCPDHGLEGISSPS